MSTRLASILYEGRLRSWARRTGLTRLLTMPARRRHRSRLAEYERTRPSLSHVRVGDLHADMHVADAVEFMRVRSVEDDRAILMALKAQLSSGDAYWDVGGSIGLYTTLLARAVGPTGSVVTFEPESRSYARLVENVALNGLTNVTSYPVALGDAPGQLPLSIDGDASSGAHRLNSEGGSAVELVEVTTGDLFRRSARLPVPSAIKVDVEGAEELVLRGMPETLANPKCHAVMCEVHFSIHASRRDADAASRIRGRLAAAGFRHFDWIDPSHLLATK